MLGYLQAEQMPPTLSSSFPSPNHTLFLYAKLCLYKTGFQILITDEYSVGTEALTQRLFN